MIKKSAIVFLTLLWTTSAFGGSIKVDPQLSNYSKQGGVSGNISSVGSDTLNNLMTLWSEKFKQFYPNVNIQVEGKGSHSCCGGGGNDSVRGVVCRTDYWSLNEPSSFLGAGFGQRTSAICLDIFNSSSSRSYISLPHL